MERQASVPSGPSATPPADGISFFTPAATVVPAPRTAPRGAPLTATQPTRTRAPAPPSRRSGRRRAPAAVSTGRLRGFRPDIEGLRAVAVLLVVLYHSHVPGIRGGYVGVDVFFVISGFLITRQLTDELARTGRVSLLAFYGRRAKRLLPASFVVTTATVLAAAHWLSPMRAASVLADARWTAFYAINYRLAGQGTDYLAAAGPPSPLQHYWSLAVEEQYYLVWPVLILAGAIVVARHRHRVLSAVLGTVAVASLGACVVLTRSSQPWAYFSLPTRAWELACGALVALSVPTLSRLRRLPAAVLTWAGLAAVVAAALVLTDGSAFPGYLALLPVLGATAVVAGGCAGHRGGAEEALRLRPMQWVGRFSYGWYLWHWPALCLVPVVVGHDLGVGAQVAVGTAALVAAVVSYYAVENPVRTWAPLVARPGRGAALGAALMLAVVATTWAASGLVATTAPTGAAAAIVTPTDVPGSRTTADQAVQAAVVTSVDLRAAPSNLTPSVTGAATDVPQAQRDGCFQLGFDVVVPRTPCMYGDPSARRVVVLYGDSHAAQWLPTLDALGKQHHWRIALRTKVSCPATDVRVRNKALHREYAECDRWRQAALADIARLRPAVVVMSSAASVGASDTTDQAWTAGTARTVSRFKALGAAVVLLGDTPRTKAEGLDCLAAHLDDVRACRLPAGIAYYFPDRRAGDLAAAAKAGALVVDPDAWFCAEGWCPAVVGPFVVFRDASHITASYARWLAPALLDRLVASPPTAAALGISGQSRGT